MSVSIREQSKSRLSSQKANVIYMQRINLTDKETSMPKSIYLWQYRHKVRNRRTHFGDAAFINLAKQPKSKPKQVPACNRTEPKTKVVSEAVDELDARIATSSQDYFSTFLMTSTKNPTSGHEKHLSVVRLVRILPKFELAEYYLEPMFKAHFLHQDLKNRVTSEAVAANANVLRNVLKLTQHQDAVLESVKVQKHDIARTYSDKRFEADRLKKLNVDRAIFNVILASAQAVKHAFKQSGADSSTNDRLFSQMFSDLRRGLDSASAEAVSAILAIQSTPIPVDRLNETVEILIDFIKKHRGTSSQKVLIAVGAAIRKVLLNIEGEQLGLAAELMKSAGSLEVPIEVELEVAKMVVHRFRYAPNTSSDGLSDLAELLLENAKVYSTAKLVNREYYGATALNSVLSIVLMRHKEAAALIEQVESVSADWFVDLVKTRLRRIAKEIEKERLEGSVGVVELMRTLATKAVGARSPQGDR